MDKKYCVYALLIIILIWLIVKCSSSEEGFSSYYWCAPWDWRCKSYYRWPHRVYYWRDGYYGSYWDRRPWYYGRYWWG